MSSSQRLGLAGMLSTFVQQLLMFVVSIRIIRITHADILIILYCYEF